MGGAGLLLLAILAAGAVRAGDEAGTSLRALYAQPPAQWPAAWTEQAADFRELGPVEPLPRIDARQAALGRRLFFDPKLSASGKVSCASCHNPDFGWTDRRTLPMGAALSSRNTPSLLGIGRWSRLGWDGAGASLREQSRRPMLAQDEMGNADLDTVADRLRDDPGLHDLATSAFQGAPLDGERLLDALTAFQATIDEPSRFDRFARGDADSLTDQEIEGLHLFRTKAGCANCHHGPSLTDGRFHNLGLSAFGEPREDLGRYYVTGRPEDAGAFRTPSLRHVSRTGPYMHSGLFASLAGVVNFYARGGGDIWSRTDRNERNALRAVASRKAALLRPLALSGQEKSALIAFLGAL